MEGNTHSSKSPILCFLLAFFLGFLGAHKAYTGRTKDALLHFVATIFVVGWLMWLYDTVSILVGKFKDAEGRTVKGLIKNRSDSIEQGDGIDGANGPTIPAAKQDSIEAKANNSPQALGQSELQNVAVQQGETDEDPADPFLTLDSQESVFLLYGLFCSIGDGNISEVEISKLVEHVFHAPAFPSFSQKMGFEFAWNRPLAFQQYLLLLVDSIEGNEKSINDDTELQIRHIAAKLKNQSVEQKGLIVQTLESLPQKNADEKIKLSKNEKKFIKFVEQEFKKS